VFLGVRLIVLGGQGCILRILQPLDGIGRGLRGRLIVIALIVIGLIVIGLIVVLIAIVSICCRRIGFGGGCGGLRRRLSERVLDIVDRPQQSRRRRRLGLEQGAVAPGEGLARGKSSGWAPMARL
jgi:hypothetical protein